MHPQRAHEIHTASAREHLLHNRLILHGVLVDQLARLVVALGLELLQQGVPHAAAGPGAHAGRLGDVEARGGAPPEAVARPLLLAAALRDAQRVRGVAGDVVGAEVGVGGGVAGLEGGEL